MERDIEVAQLQRDKRCVSLQYTVPTMHKDTWTPGWSIQGDEKVWGWNHRICSWLSIAHVPSVSVFVFRDGISRCSRQRNTAMSFDALPERILRINRNSGSRCLASGKGPVLILLGFFFCWKQKKNFLRQKDASLHCSWQNSSLQNKGLRLHYEFSWIFKKT